MHDTDRRTKVVNVVRVSSGNFLEMFDFMVFGYYASSIGRTFFPNQNAFASLMLALMTFGAGFLMRPIGAVILGAYIDRFGRRAGLILPWPFGPSRRPPQVKPSPKFTSLSAVSRLRRYNSPYRKIEDQLFVE
jgi:MFS family permease